MMGLCIALHQIMLTALNCKRSLATRTCSWVEGQAVGCGPLSAKGWGCGVIELSSQQPCEEFGLTGKVFVVIAGGTC